MIGFSRLLSRLLHGSFSVFLPSGSETFFCIHNFKFKRFLITNRDFLLSIDRDFIVIFLLKICLMEFNSFIFATSLGFVDNEFEKLKRLIRVSRFVRFNFHRNILLIFPTKIHFTLLLAQSPLIVFCRALTQLTRS